MSGFRRPDDNDVIGHPKTTRRQSRDGCRLRLAHFQDVLFELPKKGPVGEFVIVRLVTDKPTGGFHGERDKSREKEIDCGVCVRMRRLRIYAIYVQFAMKAMFIELPAFERYRSRYLDDDEFGSLQQFLLQSPEAGSVLEGSGGIRKLRMADSRRRKGKRGGLRVIYCYWRTGWEFWLVTIYDKNEFSDLSTLELQSMKQFIKRHLSTKGPS
jgi:hypothetical protein